MVIDTDQESDRDPNAGKNITNVEQDPLYNNMMKIFGDDSNATPEFDPEEENENTEKEYTGNENMSYPFRTQLIKALFRRH